MTDRYAIKAAPAVSLKEIMKAFEQGGAVTSEHTEKVTKIKVRTELICDSPDMEKVRKVLKELS